jgi:hypothetical protein
MAKPVMEVSPRDLAQMQKAYNALSKNLKLNIERKILTAVATGIEREYRTRTPQSSITGSYKIWSESTAAQRAGGKILKKAIKSKPSSKWKNGRALATRGILGVTTGYVSKYAHLVNDGHVAVYWGRKGGGRVAGIHWQRAARKAATAKSRAIVLAKAKKAVTAAVIIAAKKGR